MAEGMIHVLCCRRRVPSVRLEPGDQDERENSAREEVLQRKLAEARKAGRAYMLRSTALPLAVSLCLLLPACVAFALSPPFILRSYIALNVVVAGAILVLISMPPTHAIYVRVGCYIMIVVAGGLSLVAFTFGLVGATRGPEYACDPDLRMWVFEFRFFYASMSACTASIGGIRGVLRSLGHCTRPGRLMEGDGEMVWASTTPHMSPRELMDLVWREIGLVLLRVGLVCLEAVIHGSLLSSVYRGSEVMVGDLVTALIFGLVGGLSLVPSVRELVAACLVSKGEYASAAAGIAALLDNQDVVSTLARSRERLRSIRADLLTPQVFQAPRRLSPVEVDRQSGAFNAWYDRSQPCLMGAIDAFVSHSWRDEPALKWEALSIWCRSFRAKHGREPLLWIDRCCINQKDIKSDLPLLPVYLASCRRLLIIAGPTYLSRLWCVTELFIHSEVYDQGRQPSPEISQAHLSGHPNSSSGHPNRHGRAPPREAGDAIGTGLVSTGACAMVEGGCDDGGAFLARAPACPAGPDRSIGDVGRPCRCRPQLHGEGSLSGSGSSPSTAPTASAGSAPRLAASLDEPIQMLLLPGFDEESIGAFAVDACDCASRFDYERLIACIEAACTTQSAFNERARMLLETAPKHSPDVSATLAIIEQKRVERVRLSRRAAHMERRGSGSSLASQDLSCASRSPRLPRRSDATPSQIEARETAGGFTTDMLGESVRAWLSLRTPIFLAIAISALYALPAAFLTVALTGKFGALAVSSGWELDTGQPWHSDSSEAPGPLQSHLSTLVHTGLECEPQVMAG